MLTILWGYAVAAGVSAVLWFAGPLIIDLMATNAAVRVAAREFLPYAALVPIAGTLAYQMDGVFIGAAWSADMRNMMLLSLAVYLAAWWALSGLVGIAGLWIALLVFLGARGGTLLWRCFRRIGPAFAG
jgi:MATE family multidrug resistance protein